MPDLNAEAAVGAGDADADQVPARPAQSYGDGAGDDERARRPAVDGEPRPNGLARGQTKHDRPPGPERGVPVAGRAAVPALAEDDVRRRLGDRRGAAYATAFEHRDRAVAGELPEAVAPQLAPREPAPFAGEAMVEGDVADAQAAQQRVGARPPVAAVQLREPERQARCALRC